VPPSANPPSPGNVAVAGRAGADLGLVVHVHLARLPDIDRACPVWRPLAHVVPPSASALPRTDADGVTGDRHAYLAHGWRVSPASATFSRLSLRIRRWPGVISAAAKTSGQRGHTASTACNSALPATTSHTFVVRGRGIVCCFFRLCFSSGRRLPRRLLMIPCVVRLCRRTTVAAVAQIIKQLVHGAASDRQT